MAGEEAERDANPRASLEPLLQHKFILLAIVALVIGGYLLMSTTREPTYEASAAVLLWPPSGEQPTGPETERERAAATMLEIARGQVVRDEATRDLGYEPDVDVTLASSSDVMVLTATANDAQGAADAANAQAEAFLRVRRQAASDQYRRGAELLEARLAEIEATNLQPELSDEGGIVRKRIDEFNTLASVTSGGVQLADAAVPPSEPASTSRTVGLFVATVAGVVLALVVIYGRPLVDSRIHGSLELERWFPDLKILGRVPIVGRRARRTGTIDFDRPPGWEEAFSRLRAVLSGGQATRGDEPGRVVEFVGPTVGTGTTTVVGNTALALSRAGFEVGAVAGESGRTGLCARFDVEEDKGLVAASTGDAELAAVVQRVPGRSKFDVVPLGTNEADEASDAFASPGFGAIVDQMAESYDFVLVDAPPLATSADAAAIASVVDDVVLVVAAGRTRRASISAAAEALTLVGTPLAGVILLERRRKRRKR